MEDKFAFDDMAVPGTSSNRQIPDHEIKYESCSEDEDIKQEILDDMEFLDQDSMMGSEEYFDAARSEGSRCHDEAFKRDLVARILPKRGLRVQVSQNEMKMKLKRSLVSKKKHWLGKGFNVVEARFLAFNYVPKKTSIEDCNLLLEVCNNKQRQDLSKLRPKENKDRPRMVVAFKPPPTSGDFLNHVNRLQIAIQKKLLEDQGSHPLKILDSYTEGDLVLICYNDETKAWLESIIPFLVVRNYETGEFMKLVTYEVPEIPLNCLKVAGEIPDNTEYLSGEEVLKTLWVENPPLKTDKWKVLEMKPSLKARKRTAVLFVIDSESLPVMNKFNWILSYHGKKAKFSIKKGFTSLRWWGHAKGRFHEKLFRTNKIQNPGVGQETKKKNLPGLRQNIKSFRGNPRSFPRGKNPYYLDNRKKNNFQNGRSYFQGAGQKKGLDSRSLKPEKLTTNEESLQDYNSDIRDQSYDERDGKEFKFGISEYQRGDQRDGSRNREEIQSFCNEYASNDLGYDEDKNQEEFQGGSNEYQTRGKGYDGRDQREFDFGCSQSIGHRDGGRNQEEFKCGSSGSHNRNQGYDHSNREEIRSGSSGSHIRDQGYDHRNREEFKSGSSGSHIRDQGYDHRNREEFRSGSSGSHIRDEGYDHRNRKEFKSGSIESDNRDQGYDHRNREEFRSGSSGSHNIDQGYDHRNREEFKSGISGSHNRDQGYDHRNREEFKSGSIESHYRDQGNDQWNQEEFQSSEHHRRDQGYDDRNQREFKLGSSKSLGGDQRGGGRNQEEFRSLSSEYQSRDQGYDDRNQEEFQKGNSEYHSTDKGYNGRDQKEFEFSGSKYQSRDQRDGGKNREVFKSGSREFQNRDQGYDHREEFQSGVGEYHSRDQNYRSQSRSSDYHNNDHNGNGRNQREFRSSDTEYRNRNLIGDDRGQREFQSGSSNYRSRDQDCGDRNRRDEFHRGSRHPSRGHWGGHSSRPGFRGGHRGSSRSSFQDRRGRKAGFGQF